MCVRRTPISGFPFHFRSQAHFGAQVCLLEFFVGLAHADDLSQSCLQGLESFGHLDFSTDKVSAALSAGACLQLRIVDRGYRRLNAPCCHGYDYAGAENKKSGGDGDHHHCVGDVDVCVRNSSGWR